MIGRFLVGVLLVAMMLAIPARAGLAAELRLNGSATVARNVIEPNLQPIQSASGATLRLVANGSGNGLRDLIEDRADMAMISASMEVEAGLVNAAAPGTLEVSGLQVFPVGNSEIRFIVHPDNPVTALSEDQLRGIFAGRITDWAAVGGPAGPILVAAEALGNGTRATVESAFMNGTPIAPEARIVPALSQIAAIVAQSPGAISYGNAASIRAGQVRAVEGPVVLQPMSLVTRGEPTPDMRRVIEAVRAAAS